VDVYTYLSSRRLLTAPTPVEKMCACVDRMASCGAASRAWDCFYSLSEGYIL